jgi:hypothetical protein
LPPGVGGGDSEYIESKDEERTSESAGEWMEEEYIMILMRE